MKMKNKITAKTTFAEAMERNPKVGKKLAEFGMFCGCCPMAMMETIESGAKAHNINLKKLLEELNK
jgi:hybrid cluster-associated redox disulfide protein